MAIWIARQHPRSSGWSSFCTASIDIGSWSVVTNESVSGLVRLKYDPFGGLTSGGLNIQYCPENGISNGATDTGERGLVSDLSGGATSTARAFFVSGHRITPW